MQLTLTNGEALTLQAEINNMLQLTTETVVRFYLTNLFEKATSALKAFNKVKEELIKNKATKDEDGNMVIKQYNDGVDPQKATDDDLTEGFKEYLELLKLEISITYKPIPVEHFAKIQSKDVYPILTKFIDL